MSKVAKSTFTAINLSTRFKAILTGILLAETIFISKIIGERFVYLVELNSGLNWVWWLCIAYLCTLFYFLFRKDLWLSAKVLLTSWRIDLLILLCVGVYISYVFGGFGINNFSKVMGWLSWEELRAILFLPFFVVVAILMRKIQIRFLKKKDPDSLFMSDKEGRFKEDDGFGFLPQAQQFAERVFNQGSSDSLVFGIDAPWGTGKSTFVNFCKEYWSEKYKDQMIVYSFDPLRYESQNNLLEKFINGLVREIKSNVFAPELETLLSKYERYLKDPKVSFSFLGLSLDIPLGCESIDEIFERLETVLLNLNKKIVIVVDDLDRLNFSSIKEVLFVIKKSFTLPNLSYVLCYDTENISALERKDFDTEKIIEFLEKFVNVKTSIFLDNEKLFHYFTEHKSDSISKNRLADPVLVSKAVDGLKDILKAEDFYCYLPFIGDARKIKRLINTILLLEVEKTDFDNTDFDKQDLILLLLIYINYPNIFRKIYNTETGRKNGFFSVIYEYGQGQGTYKNSEQYSEYLTALTENQKFILNKIFSVKERLKIANGGFNMNQITREMETSYACFNGSLWSSGGRNLEEYLNLITKIFRPLQTDQYKFYVKIKDEVLSNAKIADVLSKKEFSSEYRETTHEQLWRVLVNTPSQEYTPEKSKEVITYALQCLPKHSLLEIESQGIGFRNTLIFFIVKLLEQVGWTDKEGKHSSHNTDENVIKIADWIFGENSHSGNDILNVLCDESRGIAGLYDLLLFRLRCCSDRGGDIFNLSRALSKHGDLQAPTEGKISQIVTEEMRELSQKVFQIFKSLFIDKEKNIFDEIDGLTMEKVCGDYLNYVQSKVTSGEITTIDSLFLSLKSRLKAFILYQLGNIYINQGIGCGYYDLDGKKDEKGIQKAMNDYLLGFCFNVEKNANNYMHFLDYLLINFTHSYGESHETKYVPHLGEFTKVLDKDRLATYWKENNAAIKAKNYQDQDRQVVTANYTANYKDDLKNTYEELNKLLEQKVNDEVVPAS
ncbi:P-loop ATPase [Candidatus Peregrinibacteria bacterium]|nr:P-loop ATPase [Candidatus Peregrinibacteria bacterium]